MRLSNAKLKSLDEDLFLYKKINREIAIRKLEIQTENNLDENIGGSRGNIISKLPELLAVKYSEDERIIYLEQFKIDCEACYGKLGKFSKKVFELRWMNDASCSWEEIAREIDKSVGHVYRKREQILELFYDISTKKVK